MSPLRGVCAGVLDGGIPLELDGFLKFLEGLKTFSCGSNPWVEPPAAVLGEDGNIPAVKSYFENLYRENRVVSRSLKVVLVGREGTGKTRYLQRAIANCKDIWLPICCHVTQHCT